MIWIDWVIVATYFTFAFVFALVIREKAGSSRESFFLASRSMPWWLAGISIAATTFAADTPLAITGIIASKGIAGNWVWLAWMGVHALVVVYFAKTWRRSNVATDAELIALRYSGPSAKTLRVSRAVLYGGIYNIIIIGWVLRAMGKIAAPVFQWEVWTPGIVAWLEGFWPTTGGIRSPSEGITIILLLGVVMLYSSLGGIRGVILTDLVQFFLALFGSIWLAHAVWTEVGGSIGLNQSLVALYGEHHTYLDWFSVSFMSTSNPLGLGMFGVGLFLMVQSFANIPADGGGYLMQRLATVPSERGAQAAAGLFFFLQYFVRIWPWVIVGIGALVLIPIGGESGVFAGTVSHVASDREAAYPVLIQKLLPPGVLGLMVTSLLAAFMSTIDTHLNWGASYVVHDLGIQPRSQKHQVALSRWATIAFGIIGLVVCFQIHTIEQAWQWIAAIGASLGIPTLLRWFWWRITAWSELLAASFGLITAISLKFGITDMPYEVLLLWTACASLTGTIIGLFMTQNEDMRAVQLFYEKVKPSGFWGGLSVKEGLNVASISRYLSAALLLILVTIVLLRTTSYLFFGV